MRDFQRQTVKSSWSSTVTQRSIRRRRSGSCRPAGLCSVTKSAGTTTLESTKHWGLPVGSAPFESVDKTIATLADAGFSIEPWEQAQSRARYLDVGAKVLQLRAVLRQSRSTSPRRRAGLPPKGRIADDASPRLSWRPGYPLAPPLVRGLEGGQDVLVERVPRRHWRQLRQLGRRGHSGG